MATAPSQAVETKVKQKKTLTFAYVGLLVFLVIYCGRPNDWHTSLNYVPFAKVSASVALLGLGFAIMGGGRKILKFPREVYLLFLLFFQMCLTVPFAIWRGGAFETVFTDFSKVIPIFILIVVTATTLARLRMMITLQTACVALMAFLAATGNSRTINLSNKSDLERTAGVVGGIFGNPNDFAWALAIVFPFAFALMLSAKNLAMRAFWAVAAITMAIVVMQTMSRGGLIALAASAAVTVWQYGVMGRRRYLLVLAAVGAVVLFVVAAPEGYMQRITSTVDWAEDATGSAWARQHLFMLSVTTTLQHPLFGIGPGNFVTLPGASWHGTHNTYTQFSSEAGIPALVLYIALLWSSFKNLVAIRKKSSQTDEAWVLAGGLQAALAGLVVGGLFGMAAYLFFTYFLIAYSCALHMLTIEKSTESDSIRVDTVETPKSKGWSRREVAPTRAARAALRGSRAPFLEHRRPGRLER